MRQAILGQRADKAHYVRSRHRSSGRPRATPPRSAPPTVSSGSSSSGSMSARRVPRRADYCARSGRARLSATAVNPTSEDPRVAAAESVDAGTHTSSAGPHLPSGGGQRRGRAIGDRWRVDCPEQPWTALPAAPRFSTRGFARRRPGSALIRVAGTRSSIECVLHNSNALKTVVPN